MIELKRSQIDTVKRRAIIGHLVIDASDGDEDAAKLVDLLAKIVRDAQAGLNDETYVDRLQQLISAFITAATLNDVRQLERLSLEGIKLLSGTKHEKG